MREYLRMMVWPHPLRASYENFAPSAVGFAVVLQGLVIATAVPLLQAFLRSAAVEIVAALKAGAVPPFDKHAAALQAALDEARAPLGATMVKAGSFWEASI